VNPLRLALTSIQDVTFRYNFLAAAAALTVGTATMMPSAPLQAAPAKTPIAAASALAFKLTARIGYAAPGETPLPPQTVAADVLLQGNHARLQTDIGGQPSVVLFAPPYIYRLLPNAKAGVRWKVNSRSNRTIGEFAPQDLLGNPSLIRAGLLRGGARKLGGGKLSGVPVEIYEVKNFRGEKGQTARAWLRTVDALPLRFEVKGGNLQVTASWRDYQRPKAVPASAFAPPAGFKVREAKGPPPFSGL
jgi:hypothetical protein